jgi:copper chaperone
VDTLTLRAPAIACEGCAQAIKRTLGSMPGVDAVEVEVSSKEISVQYDGSQVDETAIRERLHRAGYET